MSEKKVKRILAIGAHPDDVEFGCGAVLLKERDAGTTIALLVCSRGESGTNGTPEQRERETEAAARQLGAELHWLECGGDGLMEASKRNELAIAAVMRRFKPHAVLAPSVEVDQHPDHVAIGRAARNAARLARYGGLKELSEAPPHAIESFFWYAITPGGEPRSTLPFWVEVSEYKDEWVELMGRHASQMKTRRYVELQLARARSLGLQMGGDYGQAVWPADPSVVEGLGAAPRGGRSF